MKYYIRKKFNNKFTFMISFFYGTLLPHHKTKRPHWNWITDQIILGALPIKTKIFGRGGHDLKIIAQAVRKMKPLGMVISVVRSFELKGKGLPFMPVSRKDWEKLYVSHQHLSVADFTSFASPQQVAILIEKMHKTINAKQTMYIHCKAGRGRSWMILMCYLTTLGRMSFEEAQSLIKEKRPHVSPSDKQIQFVKNFKKKYKQKK